MFKKYLLASLFIFFSQMSVANEVIPASLPLDLSPKTLYENAHPVVQGVVIILILCSILTWTVFLFKSAQFILAFRQIKKDKQQLHKLASFTELGESKLYIAQKLTQQISEEIAQSNRHFDEDIKARLEYRLATEVKRQTKQIRSGISLLATIGSVTPFIGLFGTVWGIMNSFIGIAQTRSTDLFAVAPGIAEALFATALGLVAAIPAVMIYNAFTRYSQHFAENLQYLTACLLLAVRRDISLGR